MKALVRWSLPVSIAFLLVACGLFQPQTPTPSNPSGDPPAAVAVRSVGEIVPGWKIITEPVALLIVAAAGALGAWTKVKGDREHRSNVARLTALENGPAAPKT